MYNPHILPSIVLNFYPFFADFEAEADVFADMELKTINDFAELQTILGASGNMGAQPPPRNPPVNGFYGNSPVMGGLTCHPQPGQPQLYQGNKSHVLLCLNHAVHMYQL